jgi:hypothetical protein
MLEPKKEKIKKSEEDKKGRPSLYKPEYCEMLINHMEKGFSFRSFAGVIRVNFDTVYEWEKVHKEFSDAKKIGEGLALMYDEKLLDDLSKGTYGKSANTATHIFKLKNLWKWSDKVEIEQTTREIKINIDSDDDGL